MPAFEGEASANGRECRVDLVWAKPVSVVAANKREIVSGRKRYDMAVRLANRTAGGKPAIAGGPRIENRVVGRRIKAQEIATAGSAVD
jgi:hypothetical protein